MGNFDITKSDQFIDVSKGLYVGHGIRLSGGGGSGNPEPVYIPWNTLNSHFQVFGTTRMGKSRLLAFNMRQIIERGDDIFLVEPKGSEGQELLSWMVQYASQFDREQDIFYFSPAFKNHSARINPLFQMVNEEISGTVENMIEADEVFYIDIANEITMSALLSLEFLEKCMDPLIVDMMTVYEYAKASIIDPVNRVNRKLYQEQYDERVHGVAFNLKDHFIKKHPGDDEYASRVEAAFKIVMEQYNPLGSEFPLRTFITFRDLAPFANIEKIMVLRDRVKSELDNASKLKMSADKGRIVTHISEETIKLGQEALREIEKVATRDRVFFSKVSSTFATTMTKLSSGDVGKMLCDSKINPLRDRLYTKDKGALVIMQPFPLKYDSVANTVVKIFMSMFSSIIGEVGETGVSIHRRMHVMIDEAGAVVTRQVAENLANKGGGLKLSLHLYSQSLADYIKRLEREGAAILADNCNTKGFFRVNHNDSAEEMSAMIGMKKMGAATYTSSDNREGRAQSRTAAEEIVPPHLLQQLDPLTWVLKTDNSVYMMGSPWQEDPYLMFSMPKESQYRRVAQIQYEMGEAKYTL